MSSSDPITPDTTTDSHLESSRPVSSPPSSPPANTKPNEKDTIPPAKMVDQAEDFKGVDIKAKALIKLLKTSSVFVAIMAERIKDEQEKRKEAAKRAMAKTNATPAPKEEKATTRRSTRTTDEPDHEVIEVPAPSNTRGAARAKEKKSSEDDDVIIVESRAKSRRKLTHYTGVSDSSDKDVVEIKKPSDVKRPSPRGRGRPPKNTGDADISVYFKKADIKQEEEKPTVHEALEQAAKEYEANPEALGEQNLVATSQPKLMTGGKMKEYQLEGLEWLKSLWIHGLCGILADEMGLGKTIQAISMIAFFKENNICGPFLIVAPLSTLSNWVDEFKQWTPDISTVLYHGTKKERENIRLESMEPEKQESNDFPVICTSYDICMKDKKYLAPYEWQYMIVDEGHRLKNFNCRLVKDLVGYNAANRLLLTGTPLQNNIAELWALLHFLLPLVFNDLDSFERWFDFSSVLDDKGQKSDIEKQKRNLVSTMHSILKPFLLRRVKTDVETNLPPKREYILYAPLTPEQRDLYREILSGSARQYLEDRAVERIDAKNANAGVNTLKRKAESENSTPNKSSRTSRQPSPGIGGRRRKGVASYKDISDREFDQKLRRLENGIEDEEPLEPPTPEFELEEIERAKTIQLAKKEIAGKKLQNPVMQARLCCNSPHNFYWPFDDGQAPDRSLITASGKLLLLDRLIPHLFSKGHKVLLFSQFKQTLDILQDWATELRGYQCCRIDGAISQSDRQEQIKAFNTDPSSKLFLLSTRAGGQGINLAAADTVILFDSDWNPQQDLQAQDRAHRIGQTKPVLVYRLATKGTVEQTLLEKADSKRRLEKLVIQKGKFKSLLDSNNAGSEADEIKRILDQDDWERYDLGDLDPEKILTDRDLQILTDRSDEAYARAAEGIDAAGDAFKAVKTNREGDGLLLAGECAGDMMTADD